MMEAQKMASQKRDKGGNRVPGRIESLPLLRAHLRKTCRDGESYIFVADGPTGAHAMAALGYLLIQRWCPLGVSPASFAPYGKVLVGEPGADQTLYIVMTVPISRVELDAIKDAMLMLSFEVLTWDLEMAGKRTEVVYLRSTYLHPGGIPITHPIPVEEFLARVFDEDADDVHSNN
jgi:hypothetical protein